MPSLAVCILHILPWLPAIFGSPITGISCARPNWVAGQGITRGGINGGRKYVEPHYILKLQSLTDLPTIPVLLANLCSVLILRYHGCWSVAIKALRSS